MRRRENPDALCVGVIMAGDVLFCKNTRMASRVLSCGACSYWTHVAVVMPMHGTQHSELIVVDATTNAEMTKDLVWGEAFSGVRALLLAQFVSAMREITVVRPSAAISEEQWMSGLRFMHLTYGMPYDWMSLVRAALRAPCPSTRTAFTCTEFAIRILAHTGIAPETPGVQSLNAECTTPDALLKALLDSGAMGTHDFEHTPMVRAGRSSCIPFHTAPRRRGRRPGDYARLCSVFGYSTLDLL